MRMKFIFVMALVAFCAGTTQAESAPGTAHGPEVLWKLDFGSVKPGSKPGGGEIVEDAAATSGKAVCLTFAKEGALPAVIADTKGIALAGRGTLRLLVRGKDLSDIADGLRFSVAFHPEGAVGGPGARGEGVAYGIRCSEATYRVLPIFFDAPDEPGKYRMVITAEWLKQRSDHKPTVWLGGIELLGNGSKAAYISGFVRGSLDCAPGTQAKVTVTVVNPTGEPFQGKLALKEHFGMEGCADAASADLNLAAGETRHFDLTWTASEPEAGRNLVCSLLDKSGQEMDHDEVPFGIIKDGRELAFPARDFSQTTQPGDGARYYISPTNYSQMKLDNDNAVRNRNSLGGRHEAFSWSWCDLAGFVPPEDPFIGNQGQYWLSVKTQKEQVALLKNIGYHVESYIFGGPWNAAGLDLYERHPNWFMYDANGELTGGYDMEGCEHYSKRHEFDYQIKLHELFFAGFLNPTLKDTREYMAKQIITLGTEMGFQGARWDVWSLDVKPDWRRLDGTEIAPTWEEADRLSAESMKAVKGIVAKELPDFTWGYNKVSPEENKNTPLLLAEKARGHGWMLDEAEIGYGGKTSPYHFWNLYDKRMVEWGDHIRQLGGIYDPWPFNRGSSKYGYSDVDWLYCSIFRILAGGRVWIPLYKNNYALFGDLSLMAFRFSDTFSGWNLRLQPETQTQISVEAPESLWWKGHVFSNKTFDHKDQFIVHLVNAPVSQEVLENPDSKVRAPALNVKVSCHALEGRLPQKAWLVMAESATRDLEPKVQAVPLTLEKQGSSAVSVTVPAVLFMKTVVFEF